MKIFNKKFVKIATVLAAIIILALGVFWLIKYYQQKSPEYQAEKYLKEMEQKYREDTYGGNTPEETLQLFIDALKKGDIDLASKYFVIDKQDEWKEKLEKIKNAGELKNMISDLEKAKRGSDISSKSSLFSVVNLKNEVIAMMSIIKIPNGKWKIESL